MDGEHMSEHHDRVMEAAHVATSLKSKFYAGPEFVRVREQFARLVAEKRAVLANPPYHEVKGLAVVGEAGAGKTRTLAKVFEEHQKAQVASGDQKVRVLSLRTPSPAGLKLLGTAILRALDYRLERPSATASHIWHMVRGQLRKHKTDVLHLDEAQDILRHDTPKEMAAVVATLKSLGQDADWPLILILSGTRDLAELINSDPQLARRLRPISLDRITVASHGPRLAKMIKAYSAEAKLELADDVSLDDLVERLVHGASHQFGVAVEITIEAIGFAIEDGRDTLNVDDFGKAYRQRKSCCDEANAFWCTSLDDADATTILGRASDPVGDGRSRKRTFRAGRARQKI